MTLIVAARRGRWLWTLLAMLLAETLAVAAEPVPQEKGNAEVERLVKSIERDMADARKVVTELTRIGKPAVPSLIEALKHSNAFVRSVAAWTLGEIGPVDPRIAPSLIEAMGRVSSPPELSFALLEEEGFLLASALHAMKLESLKPLADALDHESSSTRATAALALYLYANGEGMIGNPDGLPIPKEKPIPLTGAVVTRLISLLDDMQSATRSAAAMALGTIAPGDERSEAVVSALVSHLNDPAEMVRVSIAMDLVRFGPKAKAAAVPLGEWFRARRSCLWIAADALGALGVEAAPAVPILIEAARDQNSETREYAIQALGLIGPGVEGVLPALRSAMKDPEDRVRSRASDALGRIDGPEIPNLIEALRSPDFSVRKTAVDALGAVGPDAAPAVPALIARLADEHEGVLNRALQALPRIGAAAVPALVDALENGDPRIRLGAAEVLGRIGPSAAAAADRLEKSRADDPDAQVRRYAALALSALRPGEAEGIAALAEALRDEHVDTDQRVHSAATEIANALGRSKKKEAIVALIEVSERLGRGDKKGDSPFAGDMSENSLGRAFVEGALEKGGPEALPTLLEALDRQETQGSVMRVFPKIGAPAVPALNEMLRSDNATRRAGAAGALWNMAIHYESRQHVIPTVPALIGALKDQDPRVRSNAALTLGHLAPDARKATVLLIQQLSDPDSRAANSATSALREMKAESEAGVPALIPLLDSPDREIRRRAKEVLASIGAPAVPALLKLLKKDDLATRRGSASALQEMAVHHRALDEIAGEVAIPLAEALKDTDPRARQFVAYTLVCLREKVAPALATLTALLDQQSTEVRVAAIGILRNLGAPAVPSLLKVVEDPDPLIRAAAASALSGQDYSHNQGPEVIKPLLRALSDKDPRVRAAAASSLGWVWEASYSGASALSDPIGSILPNIADQYFPELKVRRDALRNMKAVADLAYPMLVARPVQRVIRRLTGEDFASRWEGPVRDGLSALLSDADATVRECAARGLEKMGRRAGLALDPLLVRLDDPEEKVREAASKAIARLGPVAVPRLSELIGSDKARVRGSVLATLGEMSEVTAVRPLLDSLIKAIEDSDVEVRQQAAQTLARSSYWDSEAFDSAAPRMVGPLLRGLKHQNPKARRVASWVLEWTGPKAHRDEETVPALIATLDDPDAEVRKNAAVALRAFEDRALSALPALHRACKDSNEDVRGMAANAIQVITH